MENKQHDIESLEGKMFTYTISGESYTIGHRHHWPITALFNVQHVKSGEWYTWAISDFYIRLEADQILF